MIKEMGPHFICIGAQKAGTTWLSDQLSLHPEIWIPPMKEVHYFDRSRKYPTCSNALSVSFLKDRLKDEQWVEMAKKRVVKSIDNQYPRMISWWNNYLFSDYSDDWYLSLFDSFSEKITGELTPSYALLEEEDVLKISTLLPNTKIIFLMRNPVDRTWSMLRHILKQGYSLDLEDTDRIVKLINSPWYALRSDYLRTIDLYSRVFGEEKILLGFYDAITQQPEDLIKQVLTFLEIDNHNLDKFNFSRVSNPSPKLEIPPILYNYLCEKYASDIATLADRYGSYCVQWKTLLNHSDDEVGSSVLPSFSASFRLADV